MALCWHHEFTHTHVHALRHAPTHSYMYTLARSLCRSTTTAPNLTAAIVTYADTFSFWEIVSGAEFCTIVEGGRCVTDGGGEYGNDENCKIKTLRPLVANATEFATEPGYDFLTIGGTAYHGDDGPPALPLDGGTEVVWKSDQSNVRLGFTVCAAETGSFASTRRCGLAHVDPPMTQ